MTGYAADPLLARLSAANRWRHNLIPHSRGEIAAVIAVRGEPVWPDSVVTAGVVAGEDQTIAMRHRTRDDRLILPTELPPESKAAWRRCGRCADVLAELPS